MTAIGSGPLAARGNAPNASSTFVACEPNQRVVVRHTVASGELQVATECVGAAGTLGVSGLTPAVYQPTMQPAVYAAPQTVARSASSPRPAAPTTQKKRSWGRTALVIGGAAGAGAGIGGLVDGKKGALIGAAIGGGAGAIHEAIKRK
jgi:hypothetical protein